MGKLTFGSLFTGIGAGDIAFERAGFKCIWQVEIDSACRSVLAKHWPNVPKYGDIRECGKGRKYELDRPDVIVWGSPCQDLSTSGQRAGLEGARSGLFFEGCRIVGELRPAISLWENVPGALSSQAGRDFDAVLKAFHELGASDIGWRIFDAQYFGVPQRRKRVFVVADLSGGRAAEILFDAGGVPRDIAAVREAGHEDAAEPRRDALGDRGLPDGLIQIAYSVRTSGADPDSDASRSVAYETDTARCLNIRGAFNGNQGGTLVDAVAFSCKDHGGDAGSVSPTLRAMGSNAGHPNGGGQVAVSTPQGVRKLTAVECERLQGLPDGHTATGADGKPLADGTRYKMCGNAMAEPVVEWIAHRLATSLRTAVAAPSSSLSGHRPG